MEREELEDDPHMAPAEVWGRMSDEQREHVFRLLIRIACEYVETHQEGREENPMPGNTDDEK